MSNRDFLYILLLYSILFASFNLYLHWESGQTVRIFLMFASAKQMMSLGIQILMHLIISYLVFVEGTTRTASTGCPQYSDFNTCFREGNGIADGDLDTSPPFQSTPPRGERHSYDDGSMQRGDFNPRSREGSDVFIKTTSKLPIVISIHAPARGATRKHGRRQKQ